MKDSVLEVLREMHAFNKLSRRAVGGLSLLTGINCEELCRKEGITYTVDDIQKLPDWEPAECPRCRAMFEPPEEPSPHGHMCPECPGPMKGVVHFKRMKPSVRQVAEKLRNTLERWSSIQISGDVWTQPGNDEDLPMDTLEVLQQAKEVLD